MKEYVINANDMDEKELNRTLKQQATNHDTLIINNPESMHNICAGLSEDVEIKINGLPVRMYGSQGQKKSCALIMKLAQAEMLKNKLREAPVILLDDVMSELDFSRQKLVSEITDGMQVFITTCSTEAVMLDNIYNIFHIQNGSIISTSNS
jgi:recombinational DNA repair ATPase RecF